MKYLFIFILAISMLMSGCSKASASEEKTLILWVFAHPDDETLAAGSARLDHQKYTNIVIIMTDGSASGVRSKLHMSKDDFINARKLECDAASSLTNSNVIYADFTDGKLTSNDTYKYIGNLVEKYKDEGFTVRVKTHTSREIPSHKDHTATSKGINRLWKEGSVKDLREYATPGSRVTGKFSTVKLSKSKQSKKELLNHEYFLINHSIGRYGIGGLSVPKLFSLSVKSERVLIPAK